MRVVNTAGHWTAISVDDLVDTSLIGTLLPASKARGYIAKCPHTDSGVFRVMRVQNINFLNIPTRTGSCVKDLIKTLAPLGFKFFEFDNERELLEWLSETEEGLS